MTSLQATEADYKLIRKLRERKVLEDLNGQLLPAERGTIVIPCADGDRITDILTSHWAACSGRPCHHTLSLNGGPLLIPRNSPVNRMGAGELLLEHAYAGHKLKEVTTIVLYSHWPCGAAITSGMSLHEAIEFSIRAKDRTRRFMQRKGLEPTVALCFHVDWTNGVKNSYFFNRDAWNDMLEERRGG